MKQYNIYIITFILFLSAGYQRGFGQCSPDRHSTTWFDGWISCEKKLSPNPTRGSGHWLMYSFGHRYMLGKSHWWNHNVPTSLNHGIKDVAIDYSVDGINWTNHGLYTLPRATGDKWYEGDEGPDLDGIDARYLLITVISTYGDVCAGLSEVKIDVALSTSTDDDIVYTKCISSEIYPNPFFDVLNVQINSACADRSLVFLTDITGRRVSQDYALDNGIQSLSLPVRNLRSGVYIMNILSGTHHIQERLVKLD